MSRGTTRAEAPSGYHANAVHVMKIATGEIEEELPSARRNGGLVGGQARSEALTSEERSKIAKKAGASSLGLIPSPHL